MKFVALDFETTSVEIADAEVMQAAVVAVEGASTTDGVAIDWSTERVQKLLCHVKHCPAGATAVHGLTVEDVADCKPFSVYARGLAAALQDPDTIVVTYNGACYDLPILERYVQRPLTLQHVDLYRAWMRIKAEDRAPTWTVDKDETRPLYPLGASAFAGTLTGAHAYFTGEGFDGAHDAAEDCRATLRVLGSCDVGLDELLTWTTSPLPGDVDFSGKFKWEGDRVVFAFGKHKGLRIEDVDRSYLAWMTSDKGNFPADTCALIRDYLRGAYPKPY